MVANLISDKEMGNMRKLCSQIVTVKYSIGEFLKKPLFSEEGATIAEYALLLAVVVIALIGVLGNLSEALEGKIRGIIDQIGP